VNARTWISLLNLIAIVVAFVVLFGLPQYSAYAFYGLLTWILVGFVLLYAFRMGRTTPSAGALGGTSAPSGVAGGTPLPSASSAGPAATIDFCIYCGTALASGISICPACGHPVHPV
jgi:hypothetical protein